LKERLLPLATLVTPNLPEAEALVAIAPRDKEQALAAAGKFAALGAANVLFKGGHGVDDMVRDLLVENRTVTLFEAPRRHSRHTHGTGCTLATAIACGLAKGEALTQAVGAAHAYVQHAIRTAPGLGAGHGPLNHRIKP
jgi:hydroxymethylpyrimidine/phosphomethylpyrimidine kinase